MVFCIGYRTNDEDRHLFNYKITIRQFGFTRSEWVFQIFEEGVAAPEAQPWIIQTSCGLVTTHDVVTTLVTRITIHLKRLGSQPLACVMPQDVPLGSMLSSEMNIFNIFYCVM